MSTLGASWKKKRDEEARHADAQRGSVRDLALIATETTGITAVDSTEDTVISQTITVGGAKYLALRFWCEADVAGALTVTMRAYVDATLAASTRQYVAAAGYRHLDWNPYVDVSQGTRTVTVKMLTSASSLEIAAGEAQLIVETRGAQGVIS